MKTKKEIRISNHAVVRKRIMPVLAKKPPKPTESKWMLQVTVQNYKYFAQALETREIKSKIAALSHMRREFKRRVNMLQIYYRHRKYGEPLYKYVAAKT